MKKIVLILIGVMFILTGCQSKEEIIKKTVNLTIIDNKDTELYNKTIDTKDIYLIDLLKQEDVMLEYDDDKYGAYIKSLMGYEQKNDGDGLYYWAYYIDDEYAETGISNCKLEDGKTYKFVYEFYEN